MHSESEVYLRCESISGGCPEDQSPFAQSAIWLAFDGPDQYQLHTRFLLAAPHHKRHAVFSFFFSFNRSFSRRVRDSRISVANMAHARKLRLANESARLLHTTPKRKKPESSRNSALLTMNIRKLRGKQMACVAFARLNQPQLLC